MAYSGCTSFKLSLHMKPLFHRDLAMKTLTIRTTIGDDRQLTIPLPDDVLPGPAEVVVILNPLAAGLDLIARGWTEREAAETRARMKSFEADWESPGMEAYDAI